MASLVRASPLTARSSTAIAWFSRISFVESWWWNSRRASATCAWARATLRRAFSRFFDPFCLRDSSRWAFFSFFSARRRTPLPTQHAAQGGSCTFQPVVDGGACPFDLDCENCDKFVMSSTGLRVSRSEEGGDGLAGSARAVVDEGRQRVMAVGLLPGRGRVLLVGVRDHEDAVEVDGDLPVGVRGVLAGEEQARSVLSMDYQRILEAATERARRRRSACSARFLHRAGPCLPAVRPGRAAGHDHGHPPVDHRLVAT